MRIAAFDVVVFVECSPSELSVESSFCEGLHLMDAEIWLFGSKIFASSCVLTKRGSIAFVF